MIAILQGEGFDRKSYNNLISLRGNTQESLYLLYFGNESNVRFLSPFIDGFCDKESIRSILAKGENLIFLDKRVRVPLFWAEGFEKVLENQDVVYPSVVRRFDKWFAKRDIVGNLSLCVEEAPLWDSPCYALSGRASEKLSHFPYDIDLRSICSILGKRPKRIEGLSVCLEER